MNKQEIIDYVSHTPFNSNENVLRGMLDQLTNNVKLYQFQFKNISYDAKEESASLNNISDLNVAIDDLIPNEHRYVFAWADYEGNFTIRYEDSNDDDQWEKDYTSMNFRSFLTHIMENSVNTFCTHGEAFLAGNGNIAYIHINFTQGDGKIGINTDKIYAIFSTNGLSNGNTVKETQMNKVRSITEIPFTLNILVVEH